ncbi:hypothetical protein WEI85_43480 [Actinomycetes bacterium KLBMP 9797]
MRHVWTLIAAVVIAPLAWLLLAFGQDRSVQAFANARSNGAFDTGDFVRPTLCLAAVGLLLGLIATLRVSPLGAVLTGALYTTSYLALLVDPDALLDLFPNTLSVAGRDGDPTTPLRTGTGLLLGALLLLGVVSIGRWRRWPTPETARTDLPGDTGPVGLASDRPLGADGLDLAPAPRAAEEPARTPEPTWTQEPARTPEPDWTPEPSWAETGWPTERGRGSAEPELAGRYPSRAESATTAGSRAPTMPRGSYERMSRVNRRPYP